jgi:DNA-binding transcriptional LysR family regulator
VIVSLTGGARGYVDEVLAAQGRSRRVALAVPSFMTALAVIAETDLAAAMPKRLVVMHAARFGVVATPAPLPLRRWQIRAIAPRAALMDAGLAWLFDLLGRTARTATAAHGQGQAGAADGHRRPVPARAAVPGRPASGARPPAAPTSR